MKNLFSPWGQPHLGMLQPVGHVVNQDDPLGTLVLGTVCGQDANCSMQGGYDMEQQKQWSLVSVTRVMVYAGWS